MRKIHSIVQKMTIILILLIPYLNLVAMTLEEFRALPDDRIAIRTSQGVRSARPLSSEQVELVLGMTATSVAEQPAAYRVISFEDENYAYEKFVSPTKAKVKKEMELKGVKGSPFNKFERSIVKLELPFPMQKGKEYFFLAQGVGSGMVVSTHSAEGFVFNGMENLQSADNSINLAVLGLQRVMPVGPSLVVLHFGADFSTTQASRLENYAVTVNGKQVGVTNLGRRTMVDTYVPTGWPYKAIPEHKIFLQLETPFKTGDLVAVSVTEKVTTAMRTASFSFDTKKTLSNSIKINQIGYLTDSPVKMAYLGQWMGSFPENPDIPGQAKTPDSKNTKMSIDQKFNEALKKAENHTEMVYNKDGSEADNIDENKPNPSLLFKVEPDFYICDAVSGKTMFTGKAKLVHVSGVMDECFYGVDHSGENVYELDFTPVKKPGRYFVSIPQTGRSFDFDIKNDVYSKAFKLMGHGLFTQRCGIELKPPYTEWRRVACHNNGVAPTTVSRLSGEHNAFKTLSDSVDYDRLKHAALNPAILQLNADKNLLAYWPLDGNFNDASGNGYDLEPFGSNPSFEREKQLMPGKNMVYGPTVADAPNGAGTEKMRIDIANGYTMSMWIRFAGGSKFAGTLMGHAAEEWNDPRIKIGAGWGVIRGGVGIRGGELNVGRLSDGKWHHIALVVPPKDETPYLARMYVDGEIRKKADIKPEVDGKVFCLGALTGDASDGKYFDDARVYKRALKDREIKTLSRKWGDLAVALNTYGGHHDAGDYNPRSHIDVAWTLMTAYEIAPQKFGDGQLNIPEKNNGIPDILDEAHWAMRLWFGLQDVDGGVFNGTESNGDPNFIQTVEMDILGDYAFAKDAAGSYTFAAVMAQASRIWRKLGRKPDALGFLNRARLAYDWAEKNPPVGIKSPNKYAKAYLDPKAYAAAELFRTTGEKRFNDDFLSVCVWKKRSETDMEKYALFSQRRAAWAYINSDHKNTDSQLQKTIQDAVIRWADWKISYCETMGYKFIRHPQAPITWGTGAQLQWTSPLIWAYGITGNEKYREWLVRSCDNTLGANPLNMSWICNIGTRTVRAPLHNSHWSHLGEVVTGQQVQGPSSRGSGYRVNEVAYPALRSEFASLYSFCDNHFCIAMDEGASHVQAENLAAFGLLLPDKY